MTSTPQARPDRPRVKSSARNDLNRIESTGSPWWTQAPAVALACAAIATAPLRLLAAVADTAVSLAFLAAFGSVALWYTGYIPDDTVAAFLGEIGVRLLSVVENADLI